MIKSGEIQSIAAKCKGQTNRKRLCYLLDIIWPVTKRIVVEKSGV